MLRAARALLDLRADNLADATKLGLATIKRAEAGEGLSTITVANAARIIEAYERLGVVFVAGEGLIRGIHQVAPSVPHVRHPDPA